NDEKYQEFLKALQSDEVRDYINKEFDGAVIPAK
ncbi:MetQ/NlpA family ABC transporter substrate-binding protein, partial [Staphylococcus pseudintermedius]